MKTNLKPNNKKIDEDACLAAWNASPHPSSWNNANSSTAQPYKSYKVLGSRYTCHHLTIIPFTASFIRPLLTRCSFLFFRESRDRGRLRDLTKAAEMAAQRQQ